MNYLDLSESGPITPQVWMVIAMGVLTMVYAVFIRPLMKQKKDPLARTPGPRGGLARQRDVEQQMETLLVELSAMARQITAQLDTRAAKLEALIREADQKIGALRGIKEFGAGGEDSMPAEQGSSANPPMPVLPAPAPTSAAPTSILPRSTRGGAGGAFVAFGSQAVASPSAASAPSAAPGEAEDPRHAAVYQLADAGLSAEQIARRLSRPNGEIELILALRQNRRN